MIQGALKSMHLDDYLYRATITISKLNQAGYLLVDHLIWLGKVGLVETDTKKWARVSARFWLLTIIFNLVRNLYDVISVYQMEAMRLARQRKANMSNNAAGVNSESSRHRPAEQSLVTKMVYGHKPVMIDTAKNLCDLLLPLSSLKYINISPGLQGLAGITSSILGMATVWNASLKLTPS